MFSRLVVLSLAFSLIAALPAAAQMPKPQQPQRQQQQQKPHWLLGEWEGDLRGLPPVSKGGTHRILRVLKVAPGGKGGRGVLVVTASDATVNVNLKIDGDRVMFATQGVNGITHDLERRGDALEGTWDLRGLGKSGTMRLERKN
ncbi:MAG: hypothetical protein AB7F36_11355 [Reyranellaceae bacterium]